MQLLTTGPDELQTWQNDGKHGPLWMLNILKQKVTGQVRKSNISVYL